MLLRMIRRNGTVRKPPGSMPRPPAPSRMVGLRVGEAPGFHPETPPRGSAPWNPAKGEPLGPTHFGSSWEVANTDLSRSGLAASQEEPMDGLQRLAFAGVQG